MKKNPRIAENLLFDGEPVNVHPFTIMDHDCSNAGIRALLNGTGQVFTAEEVASSLTDQDYNPMKLQDALYAVVEARG